MAEQQQISAVLTNLFGYHLLQLEDALPCDLLLDSRIRHRMVMVSRDGVRRPARGETGQFIGEPDQMPIGNDTIDVVLCPHLLEYAASPHEVLREVERILIPEGHVVIAGFNPWSVWGLMRLLTGWNKRVPWCGRFYSSMRIRDWLALLGFDTVFTRTFFFRPPLRHAGLLQRLDFLERAGSRWWPRLGGIYIVVAKKRLTTLTPIKPRWRPRRSLLQGKLPEATARRDKQ
ncbi:MAG TPA: methyltransferase domain-containing protein [Gammaproteobacteria bacterium]